jgi:hypothetical protein
VGLCGILIGDEDQSLSVATKNQAVRVKIVLEINRSVHLNPSSSLYSLLRRNLHAAARDIVAEFVNNATRLRAVSFKTDLSSHGAGK